MDLETCKSCRFWLVDAKGPEDNSPYDDGPAIDMFPAMGKCRRFPPTISEHMSALSIGSIGFGGNNVDPDDIATTSAVHEACLWPVTWHASWCGEYRSAPWRSHSFAGSN